VALNTLTQEDLKRNDRGGAVATRLRNAIRDGDLTPGERLTEARLAGQFGVSRTPVREAIERLLCDGLLSLVPSRGVVVTELSREQVLHLYALREVLEGAAAAFAAQHASKGESAGIRNILAVMGSQAHTPQALANLNRDFHRAIYSASHNEYLVQAANRLADFLVLLPGTTYSASRRAEQAHIEHSAIVRAIERHDSAKAEQTARKHIREAQAIRLNMLFGGD
jgi:DNA-binding GntR family transcriptional regulator